MIILVILHIFLDKFTKNNKKLGYLIIYEYSSSITATAIVVVQPDKVTREI